MEKQFNWIPMGSIQPPSFAKCHIQSEPAMKRKIQGQICESVTDDQRAKWLFLI